ncbi:coiled-coil domain-containing protein 18 isoform X1 [Callorhinchus milii]|uniref:coiled-coil domain-containing protein 18 isoform X1 n=3 Tax=Callorhinchus milii TaxID=7868 RepID=UPI001C3FB744|nr:coiled-coil domain-containing protein 18 isoform X1 [Callorhinchus milii]
MSQRASYCCLSCSDGERQREWGGERRPKVPSKSKDKWMENLVALRKRLMKTEKSLQSLGIEDNGDGLNDQSDSSSHQNYAPGLTMEDLYQPDTVNRGICNRIMANTERSVPQKNVFSNISPSSSLGSRVPQHPVSSAIEQEKDQMRRKLSSLREDNSSLVSQNHCLVNEIESVRYELTQSKNKIRYLESNIDANAQSVPQLKEHILGLESEVEAQEKALRDAEEKLEECQWMVAEKDKFVEKLTDECSRLKNDLFERSKRGKRTEQQRNEALFNAEEISATFKEYKEKTTEKLSRFEAEEEELQNSLVHFNRERQELLDRFTSFEKELENKNEETRHLMKESYSLRVVQKDLEAKNAEMFSLLSHAKEKIVMLERELANKEALLKDRDALRMENVELRSLTACQSDRLLQYCKEVENAKSECRNLESIMQLQRKGNPEGDSGVYSTGLPGSEFSDTFSSTRKENGVKDPGFCTASNDAYCGDHRMKLSNKNSEIQNRQTGLINSKASQQRCSANLGRGGDVLDSLNSEHVTDRNDRKSQEPLISNYEEERHRNIREVEELQTRLLEAEATISTLQARMTQKINQFQQLQEELLEKNSYTANIEQELKKMKSQASTVEKQLEEKTIAYSTGAAKATELEQELIEKNKDICNLERMVKDQHENEIAERENIRKIHIEQCQELEKQIEIVQNQLEEKFLQVKKQDQTICALQEEIYSRQNKIETLETILQEAREKTEEQNKRNVAALKALQNETEETAFKVRELEAALALCNEELKAQVQQMKGERTHFEKQQSKRSEEVRHLQKDLKLSTINLQETSEQNVQFQQSLKQHQQMLQQGTTRIGELEDCQMMLERQVSKLEQELQKQKGLSGEELAKAEEKLYQACRDAEYKKQQVTDLNNTMKKLKIEMNECKNEFTALETELLQLRRDSASNEIQLNQLEMSLRETQIELEKKSDQVIDLEERLHKTEAERKNSLQQNQEMDLHLKNMRGELQGTLNQLQELRDVLQKAQNSIDDKNDTIEQLTTEFRECQNELQKRDKEVYDMDQALKDRQRELKQRAAQLTQLDLNIHEHKTETEQKIIRLQGALEKAELIVKERSKQVEILDENLQITKDQLREREFELLQKEQQINQLKSDVEGKHQRIEEYEQTLKHKEQCIAKQHQEVLGEGQQVRLARELMQRTHLELTEARQQLAQAQREMDYLTRELNETIQLSHEKEARAAHLAEELGAAQARETQLEVRAQAEINKFKEMVESLKDTHQKEISLLKERQAPLSLFSGQISETSKSSGPSTIDNFLQTNEALEDAQGKILNLQKELQAQNEEMHATNEALIIKDSEVARLQVKISGYERAMGIRQLSTILPSQSLVNLDDPRKDSKMLSPNPYLSRNINRSLHVGDVYGTDISSALNSLNCSNRIREILEQSSIPVSSSLPNTEQNAHGAGESGNLLPYSHFKHPENEARPLELTGQNNDCGDLETLSGMLNYLRSKEGSNSMRDSPVSDVSTLSSGQQKIKEEECSTKKHVIRNQYQSSNNYNPSDMDLKGPLSKSFLKSSLLQSQQRMAELSHQELSYELYQLKMNEDMGTSGQQTSPQ